MSDIFFVGSAITIVSVVIIALLLFYFLRFSKPTKVIKTQISDDIIRIKPPEIKRQINEFKNVIQELRDLFRQRRDFIENMRSYNA